MAWMPQHAGAFLDYAETHDIVLYPLFVLIMHRGLRRGEAVGLRDLDVDLDAAELSITQQITPVRYTPITTTVKTGAGQRVIALDQLTTAVLRDHLARRDRWQTTCGPSWPDTGLFFLTPTGKPWHPGMVSHRFDQLVAGSGLPPVRLHDLRHCAATYLRAAGADLKTVQETLGHADLNITADTYTSVLVELERATAEAAAGLIPRNHHPTGTDNPPDQHDSR
jgi:integrase